MALSRKWLEETLGIDSDLVNKIVIAHGETVDGLKSEIKSLEKDIESYKADADKLKAVNKELSDLKAKVAEDGNKDQDYAKLKKEYEDYKQSVENAKVRNQKETAFKEILKDAGIPEKHYAKIIKYSDVDGVELDAEGKITKAKEIMDAIKEEWADHIEKSTKKGADTAKPPKNNGGGSAMSKEDIMNIKDTHERREKLAEYLKETEGED